MVLRVEPTLRALDGATRSLAQLHDDIVKSHVTADLDSLRGCHRQVAERNHASHASSLAWDVFALSSDEQTAELVPMRVGIVTVVAASTVHEVASELRRASVQVEMATTEVLRSPPRLLLYIFSVDAALGGALAEKIVAWSCEHEPRPGLIAVVESGTSSDAEALLAAGFDDAVLSPVSTRELAARVRALHRRVHWKGSSNGRLRFGDVTLDLAGRSLWVDGKSIVLTSVELAVVRALIGAAGRPLSRVDLLEQAWGEDDLEVSERAVDNVILRLRRKLPRPELVETVRSVGFRLTSR